MKRFKSRLKPIYFLIFFLFASLAQSQGVSSVSLVNQTNRNIAANSIENPVICLAVTISSPDTFNNITLTNLGDAVTNTDITNVRVWYQVSSGQFSPTKATLIGVVPAASPNSWNNSAAYGFPVTANGKIFVTMDIPTGAISGRTIQSQVPANGCVFSSGVFPPASIINTGIQTIQTGGATNLTLNNIKTGTVSPGAVNFPVFHLKVLASGPDPLLYALVNNLGTALDGTDIAEVKFWDQPANSGGSFNTSLATYVGDLNMLTSTQWQNGTPFQWSIDNNNGLWVTVDLKPGATGGRTIQFQTPANAYQFGSTTLPSLAKANTGILTIQAGTINGVNMVPVPADVLMPGETNALVYQVSVTASGGDLLNTVQINNVGSALGGSDITSVNLWYQQGGGPFSAASAVLVGNLSQITSGSWQNLSSLQWSVADGDGLYVTVDIALGAIVGRTCVFQAPTNSFSFNSGTFPSSSQNNPNTQTITAPGMVTGLSLVNVPTANYYQNSNTNLVYQLSVAATNADVLETLNLNNSSGTADESGDLQNLTLWYQKGGGAFVQSSAVNVGGLTRVGGRQWQFTGINKVLSGDGLYVTADVVPGAAVGNTCQFGVNASSVSFQYGGNFPGTPLTNAGIQTIASPPTTSFNLVDVSNAMVYTNTLNNPILDLVVNGSSDTINAYSIANLGNATSPSDASALKLWIQRGGGPFNSGTAILADTAKKQGVGWVQSTGYVPQMVFNGDALFVTADISASPTNGRTFQMSVTASGFSLQFSGGVPASSINNASIQTISTGFSPTPTFTPTNSPTQTSTPTPTNSPTRTPTSTPPNTATHTPTRTPTSSATNTTTITPTSSPTITSSNSPTNTPSVTPTITPTKSPTSTPTTTSTFSASQTPSNSPSFTPTITSTNSPTLTPTCTATNSPSSTPTPSSTGTPTQTPTQTPTFTSTTTATNSPTLSPTKTPTDSPTPTPTATFTPTPSPTNSATVSPTNTSTRTPTNSPTITPTNSPTNTGTGTMTNTVTATSTNSATLSPTKTPTNTPTNSQTNTPIPSSTNSATDTPTNTPTNTLTLVPTLTFTLTFLPTSTNTPTRTPTLTVTPTSSNTSTNTSTLTATPSATNSSTATPTRTATNTPTNSMTPTASLTATASPSPTPTRTPTLTSTFTNTFTPSSTLTFTWTSTPSQTPTITPTPTSTLTPTVTGSVTSTPTPALALYLDDNFFNPLTKPLGLDFKVVNPGRVMVAVFNLLGEEVIKLVDESKGAGNYRVYWDGRNRNGEMVGNAPYFIVIQQPDGHLTRDVIVLK